jgi:L-malate glycosyltransferase
MNKRILVFIGGSYVSGLEVVTLHLIRELMEQGYDIRCLVSGWNDGVFKEKLEAMNVPYYEVKLGWVYLRKPFWTIDTLLNYPKAYRTAKKIIKEFDPHICHFCTYSMLIMLYPLIRGRSVYNLQETHEPGIKHRIIYKLLNKKIDYFTAVSRHIVTVLEDLDIPSARIRLIYNGIPPVTANPIGEIIYATVLVFAIIGQVVEWKGHDTLLTAAQLLIAKGVTNFKIQIFGNDQTAYGKILKQKIDQQKLESYFEWKGFVNEQDEIYRDCSVVIVPSLSGEPCSLTIIEAMSREKAVIVSDRGGNPELVQHEQTGLVFKATNPVALYDCMLALIQQRPLINELAVQAYQRAMNNYTSRVMADKYIAIYESIE